VKKAMQREKGKGAKEGCRAGRGGSKREGKEVRNAEGFGAVFQGRLARPTNSKLLQTQQVHHSTSEMHAAVSVPSATCLTSQSLL